MRLKYAVPFVTGGIALYFALLWGADAFHTLSAPSFGLEDETFARIVFSLSEVLHLGERGPLLLAASLAALKLAVAGIFLIHIGDRLYSLLGHKHEPEYLDAALMLVFRSHRTIPKAG